jgi:hypothetical protein
MPRGIEDGPYIVFGAGFGQVSIALLTLTDRSAAVSIGRIARVG